VINGVATFENFVNLANSYDIKITGMSGIKTIIVQTYILADRVFRSVLPILYRRRLLKYRVKYMMKTVIFIKEAERFLILYIMGITVIPLISDTTAVFLLKSTRILLITFTLQRMNLNMILFLWAP